MLHSMNKLTLLKAAIIILLVLNFLTIAAIVFVPRYQTKLIPVDTMTKQHIILECEKISATATNSAWSYKNCIKNLEEAGQVKPVLRTI